MQRLLAVVLFALVLSACGSLLPQGPSPTAIPQPVLPTSSFGYDQPLQVEFDSRHSGLTIAGNVNNFDPTFDRLEMIFVATYEGDEPNTNIFVHQLIKDHTYNTETGLVKFQADLDTSHKLLSYSYTVTVFHNNVPVDVGSSITVLINPK